MPGLLGKKWPAPVAQPLAPFYAAGLIVLYGINSLAGSLSESAEYKNDPRNPNAQAGSSAH